VFIRTFTNRLTYPYAASMNFRKSKSGNNRQGLPKIVLFSFGGVGILLLIIAAVIFYFDQKAVNQYTKIEGVVTQNQFVNGMARPVIRYTWEGETKMYIGKTYTNPPAFQRGESVSLFINPSDDNDVLINSFSERFLAITILGGIGGFFLGFVLLFNYLWNRF
jgi:hypothetical protein